VPARSAVRGSNRRPARWCQRKSISAAPAAFRKVFAQCPAPQFHRGPEAAQVGKGRLDSLWTDEPSDLDAPAQHNDLISCLNLLQQVAQALPGFPYTDRLGAHGRLHVHQKCTRLRHVHTSGLRPMPIVRKSSAEACVALLVRQSKIVNRKLLARLLDGDASKPGSGGKSPHEQIVSSTGTLACVQS